MEIDLQGKTWTRKSSDEPQVQNERLKEFRRVSSSFGEPYCFKPGNANLLVGKRIGSESINAEVYLLNTPSGGQIAGKNNANHNRKKHNT